MKKYFLQISISLVFISLSIGQHALGQTTERANMSNAAQTYIEAFRRDENFQRPATGLVSNGKIDKKELQILTKELESGTSQVREKLVGLLVEIDYQANVKNPQRGRLRNADIIKLLSTVGLSKSDLGQAAAARELRNSCTHDELAPYGDYYVKALRESSDPELLLLIAKAKPIHARSKIEQLATLPEWKDSHSINIALAALGNVEIENRYIAMANQATDGESLAKALEMLGFIGTTRSLKVVATFLRTPLKITVVNAFERTVRKDALAALAYNFLDDAPFLLNVDSPKGYADAEAFCTAKLGVVFEGPTPDIPEDQVFPIPLRKN